MKKYSIFIVKLAVGLTILLGVLIILFTNEKSFEKIVTDDIENISKLSSSIIYAEIDNSLTKPIFVGQTIANDLFLKNWLAEESAGGASAANTDLLQKYLHDYNTKYSYDSVSVISQNSSIYYHQHGINKKVNPHNAHDVWYYDFIESNDSYKLNVDTDEVNSNELTIFVDSKILADDGSLMGVAGVGIKMSNLQALLRKYETEYDLKAFLINGEGLIQIDSIDENIETANFFDTPEMSTLKDQILNNKTSMGIFWYPENGSDHCLITKYVDNLDWYIIIEKNTKYMKQVLISQINQDLLPIAIIITIVLLIISYIIDSYNRILLKTASIDEVTNLPNAKMFQEIFQQNTKRPACRYGVVFMFDIDNFKTINDNCGHLFGNTVLYRISEIIKETIANKGIIARWGGDEFVGVIYGSQSETQDILYKAVDKIARMTDSESITISVGLTPITADGDLETMIRKADTAMYRSKENGRNRVTAF